MGMFGHAIHAVINDVGKTLPVIFAQKWITELFRRFVKLLGQFFHSFGLLCTWLYQREDTCKHGSRHDYQDLPMVATLACKLASLASDCRIPSEEHDGLRVVGPAWYLVHL